MHRSPQRPDQSWCRRNTWRWTGTHPGGVLRQNPRLPTVPSPDARLRTHVQLTFLSAQDGLSSNLSTCTSLSGVALACRDSPSSCSVLTPHSITLSVALAEPRPGPGQNLSRI